MKHGIFVIGVFYLLCLLYGLSHTNKILDTLVRHVQFQINTSLAEEADDIYSNVGVSILIYITNHWP